MEVESKNYYHDIIKQEEIKNKQYITGLEEQVECLKRQNPEKYVKAQLIGDSIMTCEYDLSVGVDHEGELIRAKELLNLVGYYSLSDSDLSLLELDLLHRVYGDDWKSKLTEE
jgi:hypothetical protein